MIRDDFACEHLWMVTKNPALNTYNSIRSITARFRFVLPPKESGSTATFAFLQANDPEYLGGVPENHIVYYTRMMPRRYWTKSVQRRRRNWLCNSPILTTITLSC